MPVTSALAVLLLSAWVSVAQGGAIGKPADQSNKALTLGESSTVVEKFKFNAEPLKKIYKINEPIRLKVSGDKDYYLYLYSQDEDGGATQLFPNKKLQNNHFLAGRTYVMPGGEMPLTATKGNTTERLMVVASLKKLDFNYDNFDSAGDYYSGKGDFLKKEFKNKDIVWGDSITESGESVIRPDEPNTRRDEQNLKHSNMTRTFNLKINNQRYPVNERVDEGNAPTAMVLLNADKKAYNVGDPMRIMYGATEDGIVTLAYEYEDGARQLLQKVKVKAGEIKVIKALADSPGGKHTLLAWMGNGASGVSEVSDYYDEEDVVNKNIRVGNTDESGVGKSSKEVARFVIQVNE